MKKKPPSSPIPVIDLFAGPGGLGEGFSRYPIDKKKRFKIGVSIEKEAAPHKTLTLRAFYRQFSEGKAPNEYYEYLRGKITKEELFKKFPNQAKAAKDEAKLMTLGEDDPNAVIAKKIKGHKHWVLIGGPPCQAYSLVGRSKMLGAIKPIKGESKEEYEKRREKTFSKDHRHQLYREYLAIIAKHWPSVFVMENVRGILSSKLNGKLIFPQILADLSNPSSVFKNGKSSHRYRIFSFTTESDGLLDTLKPSEFLIKSEDYGVPQARHRVILLGVREDLAPPSVPRLKPQDKRTISSVIGDFPKLASGLTKEKNTTAYEALKEFPLSKVFSKKVLSPIDIKLRNKIKESIDNAINPVRRGKLFMETGNLESDPWYSDSRLDGVCNHQSRAHMKEDLWRYLFAACFAEERKKSPKLKDFPELLLPDHKNVQEGVNGSMFGDRFRVQRKDEPSTTVTSHISKDGHYFIHYDPLQYRSLTVREAARLQTFPDNYFFEGNRTEQFHQVGNAVPPLLAYQIASIVSDLIKKIEK